MKKMLIACLIMFAGVSGVMAKDKKTANRQEKTPAAASQRMAARLMLDDATTAKFAPLYEQYMSELAACRTKPQGDAQRNGVAESDAEIEARITARFDAQEKRLKIERKYFGEFKKVLTMRQLKALYAKDADRKMQKPQAAGAQGPMKPRNNDRARQDMR